MAELNLKGPDIMPTKSKERHITHFTFMIIWVGIAVQLVIFIAGAQLYPALSPVDILWATFIGSMIVAVLLTLTGDIGILYGIPYAVYVRACFGYLGTHIPAFIRAMSAIFWFGFQCWFGAYAMNVIVEMLTGYSNLNLLIIVFAILQVINMMYGMKAVAWMEKIATPAIIVIGVVLLNVVLKHYDATVAQVMSMPGEGGMSFALAVVAQMGHFITMALNIPDYTRYLVTDKPEKKSWLKANFGSFWAQSIGMAISITFFTFIGMVSGVLSGNWNPIEVLTQTLGTGSPLLLILCLLFIVLATWTTNVGANLVPPSYIIINFFPSKINLKIAAVIAGAVGLLLRPWIFNEQVPTILITFSSLLGPIAGIMICDYYLLRKRKLNLRDLYNPNGQYQYYKNINPAAIIAYIPAVIFSFAFPDLAFYTSFGISIVLYYLLMKFWIVKKYPQPEITDPNYVLDVTYSEAEECKAV